LNDAHEYEHIYRCKNIQFDEIINASRIEEYEHTSLPSLGKKFISLDFKLTFESNNGTILENENGIGLGADFLGDKT